MMMNRRLLVSGVGGRERPWVALPPDGQQEPTMVAETRAFDALFSEHDATTVGEAFSIACETLDATGAGDRKKVLRAEIATALVEAATYGVSDKQKMADAAVRLVFIDLIEIELS
jgi:hypothetical protein